MITLIKHDSLLCGAIKENLPLSPPLFLLLALTECGKHWKSMFSFCTPQYLYHFLLKVLLVQLPPFLSYVLTSHELSDVFQLWWAWSPKNNTRYYIYQAMEPQNWSCYHNTWTWRSHWCVALGKVSFYFEVPIWFWYWQINYLDLSDKFISLALFASIHIELSGLLVPHCLQ